MIENDKVIAFRRELVDLPTGDGKPIGALAALMLSQALYWMERSPRGEFWKSEREWQQELGLSRREQETARKRLRAAGFWSEVRKGVPARMFYRVDTKALKSALEALKTQENHQFGGLRHSSLADCAEQVRADAPNKNEQTVQTSLHESCNQVCTDAPDLNGANVQTNTYSTTEITPRITQGITSDIDRRAYGGGSQQEQDRADAEAGHQPTLAFANGEAATSPESSSEADSSPSSESTRGKSGGGRGKTTRGTRLPEDWWPSDRDIQFCQEKRPDLDWRELACEFRDYWHSVPGQRGVKVDWSATWRNWVRRAGQYGPAPARMMRPGPGGKSAAEIALENYKRRRGGKSAAEIALEIYDREHALEAEVTR